MAGISHYPEFDQFPHIVSMTVDQAVSLHILKRYPWLHAYGEFISWGYKRQYAINFVNRNRVDVVLFKFKHSEDVMEFVLTWGGDPE